MQDGRAIITSERASGAPNENPLAWVPTDSHGRPCSWRLRIQPNDSGVSLSIEIRDGLLRRNVGGTFYTPAAYTPAATDAAVWAGSSNDSPTFVITVCQQIARSAICILDDGSEVAMLSASVTGLKPRLFVAAVRIPDGRQPRRVIVLDEHGVVYTKYPRSASDITAVLRGRRTRSKGGGFIS